MKGGTEMNNNAAIEALIKAKDKLIQRNFSINQSVQSLYREADQLNVDEEMNNKKIEEINAAIIKLGKE